MGGAVLPVTFVICNDTPDDDAVEKCRGWEKLSFKNWKMKKRRACFNALRFHFGRYFMARGSVNGQLF